MQIILDDLSSPTVAQLLQQHLADMHSTSPPESVHALDLNALKAANIKFWCVWKNQQLLGCGALKLHDDKHGEIKSMRTHHEHRRKGVAAAMLQHIITYAHDQKLARLSLETGSQTFFVPAHQLYLRHGFQFCGPFADYQDDPNSKFMTLSLDNKSPQSQSNQGHHYSPKLE